MIKNIAIIPARGGSKRMKRKNIKDFLDNNHLCSFGSAKISKIINEEILNKKQ